MFKNIHFDRKNKKIHLWETYNGKTSKLVEDYTYKYYVKDPTGQSKTTDIYGTPVKQQLAESNEKFKLLKQSGIELYESDLAEDMLFLQDRYKDVDLKPNIKDFNAAQLDIEIAGEDTFPHPEDAAFPINLISVICSKTRERFTFGTSEYTGNSDLVQNYYYNPDEKEMLIYFMKWFRKQKFDIITGWYVEQFDLQYMINRLAQYQIYISFSPINKVRPYTSMKNVNGQQVTKYHCKIAGIAVLDYKELYENFTFENRESYALNFIANFELGEGKLELEGQINTIYKTNWNLFVEYNVMDVLLIEKLEDKKKFLELSIQIASESLIPLERVFSSVAITEGYILKHLRKEGKVMPDRKRINIDQWKELELFKVNGQLQNMKAGETEFADFYIKGGHVAADKGLYDNVLSFDAESEYPTNIMQFNISPEKKVFNPSDKIIKEKNLIKTPLNGIYYERGKGVLPTVIEKVFKEKQYFSEMKGNAKREGNISLAEYYESQRHIRKIMINAMYGVMSNKYFHLYDVDNARVVTRAGREMIRMVAETSNRYFKDFWHKDSKKHFPDVTPVKMKDNVTILSDTDSVYLCLKEVKDVYSPDSEFKDFGVKMEKILEPFFIKILDIWAEKYTVENLMNFQRELLIKKQLVLAKKKYLTKYIADENIFYDKPKLKVTGFEIRRSDTPTFCRKHLQDVVDYIMDEDVITKEKVMVLLKKIRKEFKNQKIEDISFNKSVKEYNKYAEPMKESKKRGKPLIEKRTPIQTRGSVYYNFYVETNKLPYIQINDGSKVKYVYVKEENKYATNVISYVGNCPKEIQKHFKVDYKLQLEKSFLKTIQRLFDVLDGFGQIDFNASKLGSFLKKKEVKK